MFYRLILVGFLCLLSYLFIWHGAFSLYLSLSLFFKQKTHWSHVCASEYAMGSVLCHLSIFLVNVLLHHAEILGIYSLHGEADVDSKPGKIKMKNY